MARVTKATRRFGRPYAHIRARQSEGETATGLLYISANSKDLHEQSNTVSGALTEIPYEQLCPGNDALQKLQQQFR